MDRQERRRIKQDALVEGTMTIVERIEHNPKPYVLAVVGVLAVFFAGFGVFKLMGAQASAREEKLALGQLAMVAPIVEEPNASPENEFRPSFASLESRAEEAVERLDEVSGGAPGRVATFLRGSALLQAGNTDEAIAELEEAARELRSDHTLGGAAKAALAKAYAAAGRFDEAEEVWRELTEADGGYPGDLALAGLARILEEAGKNDEARRSWDDLVSLYPQSPLAAEARRSRDRLANAMDS